jgi:DNA-binding CsgD family transcriptional regulator
VKVHLGHIFTKLNVTTRSELTAHAVRRIER